MTHFTCNISVLIFMRCPSFNDWIRYGQDAPSATLSNSASTQRQHIMHVRHGNRQLISLGVFHQWSIEKILGVLWRHHVTNGELMRRSKNAICVQNSENAVTEVGWPRAETAKSQACKRCHELDSGRWKKIKRKTTKDLAYEIAEDLQSMGMTW